jgi:hypothetical protein
MSFPIDHSPAALYRCGTLLNNGEAYRCHSELVSVLLQKAADVNQAYKEGALPVNGEASYPNPHPKPCPNPTHLHSSMHYT